MQQIGKEGEGFIPQPFTKEDLFKLENIESLVVQGRIPVMGEVGAVDMDREEGSLFRYKVVGVSSHSICFVAPMGTQPGDTYSLRFFGMEVSSPAGEFRGLAQEFHLSSEEAIQIQSLRAQVLGRLNNRA